jgi:hypothetical protein
MKELSVVVPITYWTILISIRSGLLILLLFLCLFGGRGSCWSRRSVLFVRNVLHGLGLGINLHRSEKAPIAGLDAFVRVKDDNIGAATVADRLDIGPCHVSGIFLPLRVKSLPLATIYEVKIPLRKWKKSLLQRNPAQMTSANTGLIPPT